MTIENTAEYNPIKALTLEPGDIESQEAKGQAELAESQQLPKSDGGLRDMLGIRTLGPSKDDDLFVDVELPLGWKIEPTEHNMWSDLMNDSDEVVANIFYKAAFYDRKAKMYKPAVED